VLRGGHLIAERVVVRVGDMGIDARDRVFGEQDRDPCLARDGTAFEVPPPSSKDVKSSSSSPQPIGAASNSVAITASRRSVK